MDTVLITLLIILCGFIGYRIGIEQENRLWVNIHKIFFKLYQGQKIDRTLMKKFTELLNTIYKDPSIVKDMLEDLEI